MATSISSGGDVWADEEIGYPIEVHITHNPCQSQDKFTCLLAGTDIIGALCREDGKLYISNQTVVLMHESVEQDIATLITLDRLTVHITCPQQSCMLNV